MGEPHDGYRGDRPGPRRGYTDIAAARRAFLVVTALRWLPIGLLISVFVRYPIAAGLSLVDVGVLFAVNTAFVVLFELPTGGLADSWGRRRTLILASGTGVAAMVLMVVADSFAGFVLAFAVNGIYWALDSGPLNAWYVDAALDMEPGRSMTVDLSRAESMLFGAVAAGALIASGLAVVLPAADSLAATVTLALVVQVMYLLTVVTLIRDGRRPLRGPLRRSIVRTIGGALRAGWHRPLRLLLAVQILLGAGLSAVELLWQPVTAREVGNDNDWVFGLIAATGWGAAAVGAAMLPPLVRLLGGRMLRAAALLQVAQGFVLIPLAAAGNLGWITAGYVALYLLQGPSDAAHSTLLHRYAHSSRRATLLSLNSLVRRVSGLLASLATGLLATRMGAPTALAAAAAILAAAAVLYLMSGEPPAEQTAVAPIVSEAANT